LTALVQFARLLWQSARWRLLAALGLSTLLSLTEGVSLVMVFPLIALLGGDPGATAAGPRTRLLFHLLALSHIPQSAWLATVLVSVIVAAGVIAQLNATLSTLTIGIILPVRRLLAARIYAAILDADWAFLTRRRSSDLTHFLTAEMARVGTLASSLLALASNALVALLLLALACFYAPLLSVILLAGFGLLVPWQRRQARAIYQSGRETSLRMGQVFESSMERLQNLKVVKAFSAQPSELALFTSRYDELIRELLANEWRSVGSARRFQLLSLLLLCGLILLGLNVLHLAAPAMLVFLFAFVRATPRLNAIQSKTGEILADLPAYMRIQTFLAECAANSEDAGPEVEAPQLSGALTLEAVSFAYVPDAAPVLHSIDLVLPAGEITAVAGLSGAGKSTLADLIMGLLIPASGSIAADATPITGANARAWRRRIGYVSQDTFLFHSSIRANLLWALPTASEAQLTQALEAASAQFVYDQPQGLDTVVGDRGIMLSHGQRQRLALARALLLQPALLILDEATNSLDSENEENILKAVRALGVTTLLISHRPSALRFADHVYQLEAGRVSPRTSAADSRCSRRG
jgi:ATP-binding cassette subfamily C protein